jgi:hypothetical protein
LLWEFVQTGKYTLPLSDTFPKEIDPLQRDKYNLDKIYKFDISYGLEKISGYTDGFAAQFIVDEKRILVRPFYSYESGSINSREKMASNFLDFLIERNLDIELTSKLL